MGLAAQNKQRPFTYADYINWPEDERWELLEGAAYNMSPAPSPTHQRIQMELSRQIANFLRNHPCEIFPAPFDVLLFPGNKNIAEMDTVLQPDISIICDPSKLSKEGCRGAPEFIIEILSPSTSRKDRMLKFDLYERAGVKEYWLVSPQDKTIEIFVLDDNGKYGRPVFYSPPNNAPCTVLTGMKIDLEPVFPPQPEEDG